MKPKIVNQSESVSISGEAIKFNTVEYNGDHFIFIMSGANNIIDVVFKPAIYTIPLPESNGTSKKK